MNTEKITLNISAIDLANIDLLVENGFSSNRSEFMKTAIKHSLNNLDSEIKLLLNHQETEAAKNKLHWMIGGHYLSLETIQSYIKNNEKVRLIVYGFLMIEDGVTPEQLKQCIESIKVYGVVRASKQIKDYIKNVERSANLTIQY